MHPAVLDHDFPLTQLVHEIDVVRGDDDSHARFLEAFEQAHHFAREIGIEVAGGLIRDEQRRLAHHRTRDTDALLFADR